MTTWTESDLNDALERGDASVQDFRSNNDAEHTARSASMQAVARGETPRGRMNQTERRFARILDANEDVLWWGYEIFRVRYGDKGYYTPDYLVLLSDAKLCAVEVKAHCTDTGRTRFKAGAQAVPVLRWVMVVQTSKNAAWTCRYDTAGQEGAPFV